MTPLVSIIMGSTSDMPIMEKAAKFFDEMQIPFEINALSGATITSRAITKAVNEAINLSKSYLGQVSDSDISTTTGGKE